MSWKQMLGCCLVALSLAACGSEDEGPLKTGRLTLRDGQSVDQAPECGVGLPQCTGSLSCVSFKLDGVHQARCVDVGILCEEVLACTGGTECAILESYPAQAICSGRCTGSDCDESVSSNTGG